MLASVAREELLRSGRAKVNTLGAHVDIQERNMRRKLGERSPVCALRIRQGPTFMVFAMPRIADRAEVV